MPKVSFLLLAVLGLILLTGTPALAQQPSLFQELGVFATATSSDNVELPSLMGFGAFARWQIANGWLFRVSYHRSTEETHKEGIVCD